MLLLGDVLLVLADAGVLGMWDSKSLAHIGDIELGGDFRLGGVIAHPETYLNKVCARVTRSCALATPP
jgi:hypothetical protein